MERKRTRKSNLRSVSLGQVVESRGIFGAVGSVVVFGEVRQFLLDRLQQFQLAHFVQQVADGQQAVLVAAFKGAVDDGLDALSSRVGNAFQEFHSFPHDVEVAGKVRPKVLCT